MWMTANLIVLVSILKGDNINQHRTQPEGAVGKFLDFIARMIAQTHAKGGVNHFITKSQQNELDDRSCEPAREQGDIPLPKNEPRFFPQ